MLQSGPDYWIRELHFLLHLLPSSLRTYQPFPGSSETEAALLKHLQKCLFCLLIITLFKHRTKKINSTSLFKMTSATLVELQERLRHLSCLRPENIWEVKGMLRGSVEDMQAETSAVELYDLRHVSIKRICPRQFPFGLSSRHIYKL